MRDDDDGAWEAWEMITGAACVRARACVRGRLSVCLCGSHLLWVSRRQHTIIQQEPLEPYANLDNVKMQKLKDPHIGLEYGIR